MKPATTRFVIVAAIAVLMVAVGSTAAWAQTPCPSSPSYSPDFSSEPTPPNCLTLNGVAALAPPASTLQQPAGTPNPAQTAPSGVKQVLRVTPNANAVAGSAWYNTQQSVSAAFSTTFTFQLSGSTVTPYGPADGIAFLIQDATAEVNESGNPTALGVGDTGCGIGFGDTQYGCTPTTGGIPSSLAVVLKTYDDGYPSPYPNTANSVSIQSNGTGANCVDYSCTIAVNNSLPNAPSGAPIKLADGNVHTVTISYTLAPPPSAVACNVPGFPPNPCIDVVLDGNDLFNGGVPLTIPNSNISAASLSTLIGSNSAWVGFTGGTGGGDDNQDILSWTFTPQQVQGAPVTPTTLVQTASVTIAGYPVTASFDFSNVPPTMLTIQPGTIPYFGFGGMTQPQYAALVAGTALGGTTCLLAQGLFDSNHDPLCEVNTFTATTTGNPTQSGANLPQSTTSQYIRDIVFTQTFNLNPLQGAPVNGAGLLTIPTGTAPGVAEFNDSATCPYPMGDPLYGQVCPRSIMTSVVDGPTKPSGTPKPAGSSQVFFCCEPEWTTTPTITPWTNQPSAIPVSFQSNPPPQNPSGGFQAAQGLGVSFGAVAKGVVLDPVLSFPTEQTAITSAACPGTWNAQVPVSYNVSGSLTQYDNSGNGAPFTEGAYTLLYAPLDCDEFLGLQYPSSINLNGAGTSPNLASWNTAPFGVDLTNPNFGTITLSPSAPGNYYAVGSTVKAFMTCTDPIGVAGPAAVSGIASCGGIPAPLTNGTGLGSFTAGAPLTTSSAGAYNFSFGGAGATDAAGNSSTGSPTPVSYTVVGNADLAIGMLGGLLAKTGQTVTYDIGVADAGPSAAEEVTVVDTVPSYATPVSATYATGSCTISNGTPSCSATPKASCAISGNTITCNIGALNAWIKGNPTGVGIQVTVKVNAIVKADTVMTNSVSVSGVANADPNLKNNTAVWPTLITN